MLGDDLVERLVPAKRMGADDRRLVAVHERQQLGQLDAGQDVLERGQAVDQEMPLGAETSTPEKTRNGAARAASSASSSASHW